MENFVQIPVEQLDESFVKLIRDDWALITGTKPDGSFNMMTASWGGIGHIWNYDAAFIFVRPQRYTYEFTEAGNKITLSFFDDAHHGVVKLCGAKSGRDMDKAKAAGITPVRADNGAVYYEEAKLVIVGRKLYGDFLREEGFCDERALKNYPTKDFHKMYVLAIEQVLKKAD